MIFDGTYQKGRDRINGFIGSPPERPKGKPGVFVRGNNTQSDVVATKWENEKMRNEKCFLRGDYWGKVRRPARVRIPAQVKSEKADGSTKRVIKRSLGRICLRLIGQLREEEGLRARGLPRRGGVVGSTCKVVCVGVDGFPAGRKMAWKSYSFSCWMSVWISCKFCRTMSTVCEVSSSVEDI